MMSLEIAVGALLAIGLILHARRRGCERRVLAVALVVAAVIYVLFPTAAGRPEWIPLELLGVLFYGAIALVGYRRWPLLLAVGWLLHLVWDLPVHPDPALAGVPGWYPGVCIGFDLVMAFAAVVGSRAAGDRR